MITRYNLNDKQGSPDLDTTVSDDGKWMWAEDVLLVEERYKAQERGLREENERLKKTNDVLQSRLEEREEEVAVYSKALEGLRKKVCAYYSDWYDKGIPNAEGATIAYELMSIVRNEVHEALKGGRDE